MQFDLFKKEMETLTEEVLEYIIGGPSVETPTERKKRGAAIGLRILNLEISLPNFNIGFGQRWLFCGISHSAKEKKSNWKNLIGFSEKSCIKIPEKKIQWN